MKPTVDTVRGDSVGELPTHVRLGELLIAEELITSSQLEEALRAQRADDHHTPLGDVLIARKVITRDQLLSVLERHRRSSKLGDVLVKSREISRSQLAAALEEQRRTQEPLGAILLRLGSITEERLRVALCRALHIRFYSLDAIAVDLALRDLVSEAFAMTHRIVPLSRAGNLLVLAMDDPTQTRLVDELQARTGLTIEVITSTSAHITRALARLYRAETAPSGLAATLVGAVGAESSGGGGLSRGPAAPSADDIVVELLRLAVDRGASDVHLETSDAGVNARLRVDGVLRPLEPEPRPEALSRQGTDVLARVKSLAGLDATEPTRPQEGRFQARIEIDGSAASIDFRVSSLPGIAGENVAIRVLDPRAVPDSVAALRMARPVTEALQQLIRRTEGMILVTGPASAGKRTSLLGIVNSVWRPDIKIVSAEDPVHHVCPRVSQHEVDDRDGRTFAAYAHAFLRHDPDVIVLGELRDPETALLAFRAAQTGRLVLTALNAGDPAGALDRLRNLRIDGGTCGYALRGVLAQRLVRAICRDCREEYAPPAGLMATMFETVPGDLQWYRGRGCAACQHTGYRGQLALAELWMPGAAEISLLREGAPSEIVVAAARTRTHSLASDAHAKLREGSTTLDELLRVLPPSALQELRTSQYMQDWSG